MPTAPEEMTLKVIAHIHTAFPTKFGIPRQSGLVDSLRGEVIFTPEYRSADAVRGLEDFSHIWLVWQFSGAVRDSWSPTVRPPRLGGNTRMGVFATRSPFRPNPLGLSSVKLEGIEMRPEVGPVLLVRGPCRDRTTRRRSRSGRVCHRGISTPRDFFHSRRPSSESRLWSMRSFSYSLRFCCLSVPGFRRRRPAARKRL